MPCGDGGNYRDCSDEALRALLATRACCDVVKTMRKKQPEVWKELQPFLKGKTLGWIKVHDREDKTRRTRNKKLKLQVKRNARIRKRALAKLTRKERASLNLTDEE